MSDSVENGMNSLPFFDLQNDSLTNLLDEQHYNQNVDISNIDFTPVKFFDNPQTTVLTNEEWDIDTNFYPYKALANAEYNECKYFDIDTFKAHASQYKSGTFSMIHCNIRSSVAHNDEFYLNLMSLEHKFSVIGLCETWLKTTNCHLYGYSGYVTEHKCRENKRGGGVSLYIDSSIEYKRRHDLESVFDACDAEVVCVEIPGKQYNTKPIIVAEMYRPPNTSVNDFITCMDQLLSCINSEGKLSYLMGDYNINLINVNQHEQTAAFVNGMFSHSFIPLIDRPTRITPYSATLIDHIYTNTIKLLDRKTSSGVLCINVSDHLPVFHMHDLCNQSTMCKKVNPKMERPVINTRTLGNLKDKLCNQDWSEVIASENVNKAYETFNSIFMSCYTDVIPMVKVKACANHKPWVTTALINSIKKKSKLYAQFCQNKCSATEERYKSYKNKLTNILRAAEKQYVEGYLSKYRSNAKKTWSLINDKLGANTKVSVLPEFSEGNECQIATDFNNYFVNVGPLLAENMQDKGDPLAHMGQSMDKSMYFKPVDEKELLNHIDKLKDCSAGIDRIKATVVKAVKCEIIAPLLSIVNQSLREGAMPDMLKIAVVTPIYKKGCKNVLSNYRPVSVLPVFSKLFERVVNDRIINYFEKYNLMYEHQYGFRKRHSTDLAITTVVDYILTALNNNKVVCGVYMDLSKAFDTLNFDVLLKKLKYYGINGPAYKWIQNYLTNRKQVVKVNDMYSSPCNLTCGVPQGSILGPTLFLIYINDLNRVSDIVKVVLFADDSNVFKCDTDVHNLVNEMNNELEKIDAWFKSNQLTLNISKTHYMIFTRQNLPVCNKIVVGGKEIEQVSCTVFLGIHIDDKLTWKRQIEHVTSKVNKCIGILYKLKNTFPKSVLLQLYKSIVYPHLYYCNSVWGSGSQHSLSSLYIAQKKALKIALKLPMRTPTDCLFNTARVLTLAGINRVQTAIFMYKYSNNLLPTSFSNKFVVVSSLHNYSTRSSSHLDINMAHFQIYKLSMQYKGPKLWNNLPTTLKECQSLNSFKTAVKNFFI